MHRAPQTLGRSRLRRPWAPGLLNDHSWAESGRLQRLAAGLRSRRCARLQTQVPEDLLDHRLPGHRGPGVGQAQTVLRTISDLRPGSPRRIAAMIFSSPPQFGQCSSSISNTRLSSRAQLSLTGWCCATAGESPASARRCRVPSAERARSGAQMRQPSDVSVNVRCDTVAAGRPVRAAVSLLPNPRSGRRATAQQRSSAAAQVRARAPRRTDGQRGVRRRPATLQGHLCASLPHQFCTGSTSIPHQTPLGRMLIRPHWRCAGIT